MNLQQLNIEDREEAKYATKCVQCADSRKKENTKSLMVYKDEDGIRYECLNPGCDWYGDRKFMKYDGTAGGTALIPKIEFQIPIPPDSGLVPKPEGALVYEYKNENNAVLYYLIRTQDKKFFPMARTADGEWIAKKPPIKALYGAEYLKDKKDYIIVVEGEKAADAARFIFTNATVVTWQGGAPGVKNGDWDLLEGRKVVLWPDNDEPGIQAMKTAAGLIHSPHVSIVDVSSLPPKADLADEISKDQIMAIWNTRTRYGSAPTVTGLQSKEQIQKKLSRVKKGEMIGFHNMSSVRLPSSGQVIIEGRTGHGKTTVMVNIFARKIQEGKFPLIFYSLEQPVEEILVKLTMILDGRVLDDNIHTNTALYFEECERGDNDIYNSILDKYGTDIFITDDYITSDKLVEDLTSHSMKGAMVFIDYAQYVPQKSNNQSRYLIIKDMVEKIQNVAKKNQMVVFTGSQLTIGETPDRDSPRECWDINFAADLVIRVWNKRSAETRGATWKEAEELPGNFILKIMKNRGGLDGSMFCFDLMNGGGLAPITTFEGEF